MSKVFIDTNILVYSIDDRDMEKKQRARNVITRLGESRPPVISTQVVHEFYSAATTKLNVDPLAAKKLVHTFRVMEIVDNTFGLAEQAIDISILFHLSFWDSLIVAASEIAKCEYILSEDFSDGGVYRGVTVVNPFKRNKL